jgi:hypothetical protein
MDLVTQRVGVSSAEAMRLVSPLFLAFGFRGIDLARGGVHSGVIGILIRECAGVPTCTDY